MGFEHYRRIDLMRDQTESHFVKLLQHLQKPLEPDKRCKVSKRDQNLCNINIETNNVKVTMSKLIMPNRNQNLYKINIDFQN